MYFISYALYEINSQICNANSGWGIRKNNSLFALSNLIEVGILPIIMKSVFAHNHHAHHHIPMREPGDSLRVPEPA
jgi:hypothetical protein